MADMIQIRRDTAANWTSANPILAQGELGAETDTSKIKIGDGTTAWASLGYLVDTGGYAAYGDTTANFTGTLQNSGSNVLVDTDIGVTVQGYNQDTAGTAAKAINIAGGSVGTIPYQTASDTTAMLAVGTAGQVLQTNGAAAPTWVTPAGGAMVLLSTVTASAASTVDIETTFDSTYDNYIIIGEATVTTDGGGLRMRYKLAGSYVTSAYQYHVNLSKSGSTSYAGAQAVNDSYIAISDSIGNASDESIQFSINITNPTNTSKRKLCYWDSAAIWTGGEVKTGRGVGTNTATGTLTGVRVYSNTTLSGTFRLYGIVK